MATVEVSDATFKERVLDSDKPVLVDFWASWCAPCRIVAPALEALSERYEEYLVIAKLDVDASPRTAGALRIQSIPTLMLFQGGKAVQALQGALPVEQLAATLESWLPELRGPSIAADDLQRRLTAKETLQVLDVRSEGDFARSHLRGSRQVSPEALEGQLEGEPLSVLVCRTGDISAPLARAYAAAGHRVFALSGGILEWEGRGYPTFSNREEAELERAGQ